MYKYNEEALYGRALFSFQKEHQEINVAFEPYEGDSYIMIIFSEDGETISNPHDPTFSQTLDEILNRFDNGQGLNYKVAAL